MSSGQTFPGLDPNQHKRVSVKPNPGFLGRLGETAGGTVVGVGLFFLSVYVLFTNEGRALQTASSLDEGLSHVVSLGPYSSLDLQNNNRLVHLSAQLRTLQSLIHSSNHSHSDHSCSQSFQAVVLQVSGFHVSVQPLHDPNYKVLVQAVKLRREVEMYQWVEYSESRDYQENGETKTETTYTYNTEWKSELINSRHFDREIGHQNPSAMAVESVTVVAPEVQVGPFALSKGLVEQISNFQTLSLREFPVFDLNPFLSIDGDYFYHTQHPRRPEVGDVRVQFSFAGLSGENSHLGPPQTASVVAMQRGERLMPFKTKSGDFLEILYLEELSAEEVFSREHQYNSMKTWGLRAAGWLLMFLSIQLTMRIIYTLVDWVPILRDLVSVGLKIFALCISSSLSLLVIGVGWLFYRPFVAVVLTALALLPVFLTHSRLPAKKNE